MMSSPTLKKTVSLLILFGFTSQVAAVTPPNTNTSLQAPNPQNQAIEFTRQAGSISGVAQACGENTADFMQRISEAVTKLTANFTDRAAAMLVYQQIAREAQMSEQKTQTIPCTKVLQDYRNLPIMQADYKEKVIAQLNPSEP